MTEDSKEQSGVRRQESGAKATFDCQLPTPHVSTAAQIREHAVKRLCGEDSKGSIETVALPSGLVFSLRRPRPLWWALQGKLASEPCGSHGRK